MLRAIDTKKVDAKRKRESQAGSQSARMEQTQVEVALSLGAAANHSSRTIVKTSAGPLSDSFGAARVNLLTTALALMMIELNLSDTVASSKQMQLVL